MAELREHQHVARWAGTRAALYAIFALILLIAYAGWVTDGFRQFTNWGDFRHWAHEQSAAGPS